MVHFNFEEEKNKVSLR